MTTTAANRTGLSWSARLLIGLCLLIAGAAAATWALSRYDQAARFLGVSRTISVPVPVKAPAQALATSGAAIGPQDARRIAIVENRLAQLENATQRVEGSAGRADALLVAFAARRAVDRGVALGYLEPLLVDRFGRNHPSAVSTIITGARAPVRLNDLMDGYEQLGPLLRSGNANRGLIDSVKQELGSLVQVRRAGRPSQEPDARYLRAKAQLGAGEVDAALAETMRMPAAARAAPWIEKARRYVGVHRALDEVESSALIGDRKAQP